MTKAPLVSQGQKNLRGILLMLIAMAAFVVSDTVLKIARRELDAGQILFIRGLFSILMMLALLGARGQLGVLKACGNRRLVLRGSVEAVVALLFITAIGSMALADITAVLLVAPLIITALTVILWREKVGWRRWLAVFTGFAGVMLVLKPGGHAVPFAAGVMAMTAAVLVAVRDLMTRGIAEGISTWAVAMTTTLGTMLLGGASMLAGPGWHAPSGASLAFIALAAIAVILGNYAVISAHRDAELSVVSPFRFSVILWALVIGVVVFGEWPDAVGLFGAGMIVASGIYTAHRERIRRKEAENAAQHLTSD